MQTVTTPKADPVITAWPNASQINYGQALSAATLSDGASTPAGNFAFAAPATATGRSRVLLLHAPEHALRPDAGLAIPPSDSRPMRSAPCTVVAGLGGEAVMALPHVRSLRLRLVLRCGGRYRSA